MRNIFHRTSVREYLDKEIEQEKIDLLLKAAMAAPSAGNQQPWEFYVVKNKEILKELAHCSPYAGCVEKAPVGIVLCYRREVILPMYAQIDLSACTQNLLLAADSLGLGAVWLGIAPLQERMDKVAEVLKLDDGIEVFAIVPIGYPVKEAVQQNRYDENRIHIIK